MVLVLAPRGFSPGAPVFLLSSKTNILKFQFDLDEVDEKPHCECATANSHLFHFYYLFITFNRTFKEKIGRSVDEALTMHDDDDDDDGDSGGGDGDDDDDDDDDGNDEDLNFSAITKRDTKIVMKLLSRYVH